MNQNISRSYHQAKFTAKGNLCPAFLNELWSTYKSQIIGKTLASNGIWTPAFLFTTRKLLSLFAEENFQFKLPKYLLKCQQTSWDFNKEMKNKKINTHLNHYNVTSNKHSPGIIFGQELIMMWSRDGSNTIVRASRIPISIIPRISTGIAGVRGVAVATRVIGAGNVACVWTHSCVTWNMNLIKLEYSIFLSNRTPI